MTPTLPDPRVWKTFARDKEFPFSTVASVLVHLLIVGGLIGTYLASRNRDNNVEWESVAWSDPPGIGNSGVDSKLAFGSPLGKDSTDVIETPIPRVRPEDESIAPVVKIDDAQPALPPDALDGPASIPLKPIPKLASLLKGASSGNANKGTGGTGPGVGGIGKGTSGSGTGADGGGRMSQKAKRQLRWTLLFSTSGPADYLEQLQALKALMGVQAKDKSVRMIRDLSKRPAVAESTRIPAERIFWMDDNPDSVRAMIAELQIGGDPWRVIAFFPETLEKLLLDKELRYGKSFGRNSEDEIKETKFRVEYKYGQAKITVIDQH